MLSQVDNVHQSGGHEADVFEALHGLLHLHRARLMRALREMPQAPTHMELRVLGFFARHPDATQTELVEHSGRDKSQIAKLIAGLRTRGLLEARAADHDRRVQCLRLTAQGRKLQAQLMAVRRRLGDEAAQGLSRAERAQLASLVAKLQEHLQQIA